MFISYINTDQLIIMLKFIIFVYATNKSHILTSLILLEFMAISITLTSFIVMKMMSLEFYLILFIMILLITESILGLSILINIIRTHSNDYLKSASVVKY